jgi:hypothetical protein
MHYFMSKLNLLLLGAGLFLIWGCRSGHDHSGFVSTQDPVGRVGRNRYYTPANQLLTPAGLQVELPGLRPQALALSPDKKLLVTSGKTAELVVINPGTGAIVQRVELPSEKDLDPAPNAVSANILGPDDKGQVSFEREPSGFKYPEDFRMEALREFAVRVKARNDWSDDHTVQDVLQLLHLGKLQNGAFTPNVACALLFATDPAEKFHGCRIRFLRFEGDREGTGERFNTTKDLYRRTGIPAGCQQLKEETKKLLGATADAMGSAKQTLTAPFYQGLDSLTGAVKPVTAPADATRPLIAEPFKPRVP